MSSSINQNEPTKDKEKRPSEQLVQGYGLGKWISDKDIEILALKKYQQNRRGITYLDLMKEFKCSKLKAQRRIKNACIEKIYNKEKKAPILFRSSKRTIPQQFFPYSIRAEILEDQKHNKNILMYPTGDNYHLSTIFLERGIRSSRYLLELFSHFLYQPIFIHKLFLQTYIDPSYYKDIDKEKIKGNNAIQHEENFGPLTSKRNVKFIINTNGTVMIYISCSRSPFKLENGEDISYIFSFLGQVRDRLLYFLSDLNERTLPSIMEWKLNQCDINKDIQITEMEQLTLPDIQLKMADRVFRLYVKALEQTAYYRVEESKKVDQKISSGFEYLLKSYSSVNEFDDRDPNYIQ